jgi:hypothetical protein
LNTTPADIAAAPAEPAGAAVRTWRKTTDRPLRSARKSLAIWAFAHWAGVPVPWRVVRQRDAKALLAYEHARLVALAEAGERVPPVLSFDGHTLVTGDVGAAVDAQLHAWPPTENARALALMQAVSADLAAFHAHGHWHGGAQARNITWDGQHFARLDFEEPLVPALPLGLVQAYDVLQLLLSLARLLEAHGPEGASAVLRAYVRAAHAAHAPHLVGQLRALVLPLLPKLSRLSRWAAWSARLDTSREVKRLRTVLAGLQTLVAETAP